MITFVRTRNIAPGKFADATAYAQHVTKHVKEKYGVQINISVPIGGNPDRMAFVIAYKNLAELEENAAKLPADADYQKLVGANAQTFLPGSTHDEMWMSV
jgi:hypothetical protein